MKKKWLSVKATAEEICAVEDENMVYRNMAVFWFRRFNIRNINLKIKPRSGLSSVVDYDDLLDWMSQDYHCDHSRII